jgi:imidazolonepropionase-like amidohydrolase
MNMNRIICVIAGALTCTAGANSGDVASPAAPLLLAGARVLDPAGAKLLSGLDVLVENGRIASIAPAGTVQPPDNGKVLKLDSLVLLPGLIEMHAHLLLHPYNETSWEDQVLKEPLELRTIRGVVAARATLEAGFTTLRDLGTEGAGFADVALRDAVAQGLIPGPRILTATRAIVASGCYGPAGFDPRWDVPKGAQVADGVEGVRRAVREQIAAGADWVKVYADYRRRPGDPATPTFSQEELNALVYEARSAGRPVAAHAGTDEGIRRAVLGGVNTVEHGTGASADTLELMKQRGVALCPTLAASEAIARYAGWQPGQPDPPRIIATRGMFARALESGVVIVCGGDVGVFPHGDNARELELMVEYGMSAPDALRSATITAAKVLGHEKDLGRIEPGYVADLIAVRRDPLSDISAVRRPALVIKNGQIAVDSRQ